MQSNRPLAVCPSTLASIPFGLALCSMSFAAQPPTETPSDVQKLLEKNAPLVKDAEEKLGAALGTAPQTPEPDAIKLDEQAEPNLAGPANTRSTEPLRVKPLKTPNTSISGIGTGTTPEDATEGRLPSPTPLPYGPDRQPGWSVSTKNWVAPAFCHFPTYYDDVMLEYHGHERCPPLQPILSGGRFFTGIFFTPYLAYLQPPTEQISNAGLYRPGTCAPGLRQRAPYDPTALKVQAAATATGVVLLQP